MASKTNVELAKTCKRYYETCLYNSTTMFVWLRWQRCVKAVVTVVPIILGSTPGAVTVIRLLTAAGVKPVDFVTSILSLISGLTPLIYNALKLDDQLETCRSQSGEYANLRDRFRTAAEVSINKSTRDFEADVEPLIQRLEELRAVGITTPDWAFKKAQVKIKAGHYDFEVDQVPEENPLVTHVNTEQADVLHPPK